MQSTAIRSGLAWGFWGALYGGWSTYRHNGNQWGWNVAGNAGVGFGVGFLGGYFVGPLPASAWQTPAARWLVVLLTAAGLTQAVNEWQSGYPDIALLDAL